jgi:hypothetical protein
MKINVLLRTCNRSENNPDMKRIVNVSRDELILRCANSLVTSINYAARSASISIHVIDDSEENFQIKLKDVLNNLECPWSLETRRLNNNESMKYCYEYAKENFEDDSAIFFCEDDYLYFPNCFFEMIRSYELFKYKLNNAEVALHPADSPLEYLPGNIYLSRIVLSHNRHWRTSVSCPFTMLISKTAFIRFYDKFIDYAKFDGVNYHEANTINLIFVDQVNLFTPIPSLCFHLGYIDPPAPFCDYKRLWGESQL